MLPSLAIGWLWSLDWHFTLLIAGVGIALALIIHRFGFSKLTAKNGRRIEGLIGQKHSPFAFQEWKSYPLVAFMIALGITLRNSPQPKHYPAILYLNIGISLFLSSLQYYRGAFQIWGKNSPPPGLPPLPPVARGGEMLPPL